MDLIWTLIVSGIILSFHVVFLVALWGEVQRHDTSNSRQYIAMFFIIALLLVGHIVYVVAQIKGSH